MNTQRLARLGSGSILTAGRSRSLGALSAAACFLFSPAMTLAQSNCGKPPKLIFIDGFRDLPYPPPVDTPPPITLPAEATPLAIQIASPPTGAVTRRNQIEVRGTFDGPPNTGITINGSPAFLHGNQFVLPALKLPAGPSTIEARGVAMSGASQVATADVTVDNEANVEPVVFDAARAGGFAPMPITFSWSAVEPLEVVRVEVDFDGNGVFDLDTTDLAAPLKHVYRTPGVYVARLRLTTAPPTSTTYEATRAVVSVNSNYIRATLCYVYERMRTELAASNVPAALQMLHPDLRPRFDTFWTANLAQLPTIASQLGTVADGILGRDTAQLMVTQPAVGANPPAGFFINFEPDVDGTWRITGM